MLTSIMSMHHAPAAMHHTSAQPLLGRFTPQNTPQGILLLAGLAGTRRDRRKAPDRRRATVDNVIRPIRFREFSAAGALALALLGVSAAVSALHGDEAHPPAASASRDAVRVLVAYHSRTGNTEQMARGAVEGVQRVPGVSAVLKRVQETTQADLEAADGIILGSPTYFANIPGEMKTIIDDWNWKWRVDFTDKVGGAFATAGGQVGGQGHVVVSLLLFMLHNRMIVVGPLYQNERTGSIWAEAGAAAITGPLDLGVGQSELEGARRLGERVARLAKQLKPQAGSTQDPSATRTVGGAGD